MWQASDDRLEQMELALGAGTAVWLGATVVPPPPGTAMVTPKPPVLLTRSEVQMSKFSEHWLYADAHAPPLEKDVGTAGKAKSE